jgi:hypothetical protein
VKLRLPSPAMVIAIIALFVALGGTAVAAGIVPKAKVALNALKLQGKTAAQVAATPGPASSASGLVSNVTASFSAAGNGIATTAPACPSGSKAVSGGYSSTSPLILLTSAPSSDGSSWQMILANIDSSAATGTGYAICLK